MKPLVNVPKFESTQRIAHRVKKVLATHGHRGVELEFRLGRTFGDRFVAGVSHEGWTKIARALEKSHEFVSVPELVTRESILSGGWKQVTFEDEMAPPQWNHKQKVDTFEISDILPDSPWAIRASLNLEQVEKCPPASVRECKDVASGYVRNKKRTSYTYKCWSIDMTRVQSNLPGHDDEIFEVEIELADQEAFFKYTVDHLVIWGQCLVKDMVELAMASV
jgi:hypothetical protein